MVNYEFEIPENMQQPFGTGGQGQMPTPNMMPNNPRMFQPMMGAGQPMQGSFQTQQPGRFG